MTYSSVFPQNEAYRQITDSALATLHIQHGDAIHVVNTYQGCVYHSANRIESKHNSAVLRTLIGTLARLNCRALVQVSNLAEKLANEEELENCLPIPFVYPRS